MYGHRHPGSGGGLEPNLLISPFQSFMACHKEAESMHEAPKRQREREREREREEVPAGNTVGSEGDDWAPWNGGAGSLSGSLLDH